MAVSAIHISELVDYVSKHPYQTLGEIADHFGAKERTVRSYIQRANDALSNMAHIDYDTSHRGYVLIVTDKGAVDQWMSDVAMLNRSSMPSNSDERVGYLLSDLLFRDEWVTLDELAGVLYVSRTSISNDLKKVEERLADFDLVLERKPHYGIRVKGTEMNRRLCMASIVTEYERRIEHGKQEDAIETVFAALGNVDPESSHEQLQTISECVNDAMGQTGFAINPAAYQNLIVHIAVAIGRIRDGRYVPMELSHLADLKKTDAYSVAADISDKIRDRLGIELPQTEIAYISIHLAGKRSLNEETEPNDNIVISDEVWGIVSRMLEVVWQAFRFDFRGDLELRMNLARHIVPLSVRMRYNMELKNPLLGSIKTRYPLAYSMSIDSSRVLVEHYGAELSDDELGYIALAFALALERRKSSNPKKKILVVCASGAGTSRLLEYRCRKEFGEWISSIRTSDAFHLDSIDFSDIDYVFSTVHIDRNLPVPVCELRYFLDTSEIEQVRGMLRDSSLKSDGSMARYFSPELFFSHRSFASKTDALDFMLDRVEEHFDIDGSFREAVWAREAAVATTFGNDVAMPHPIETTENETFGVVMLLDEPVVWDEHGRGVRAVFLMNFSRSGGEDVRRFIESFAEFLIDTDAVQSLIADQRWDTFKALLESCSGVSDSPSSNTLPGGVNNGRK